MAKSKAELRKQILKERNFVLSEQRQIWDRRILERLMKYDEEKPCDAYLCYVNGKSEVDTKEFILWCLQKKKTVFVPKVLTSEVSALEEKSGSSKNKRKAIDMAFYRIFCLEDLKVGYQGILEPEGLAEDSFCFWMEKMQERCEYSQEKMLDSQLKESARENLLIRMLMPGAVFDKEGNRIGYGGGFYDKWIAKWEKCGWAGKLEKMGLAYQMQIVEEIPIEPHDQKVDFVVTEKGISLQENEE